MGKNWTAIRVPCDCGRDIGHNQFARHINLCPAYKLKKMKDKLDALLPNTFDTLARLIMIREDLKIFETTTQKEMEWMLTTLMQLMEDRK